MPSRMLGLQKQKGVAVLLLQFTLSLNGVNTQGVTCQRDWMRFENNCYRLRNEAKTWDSAQRECQKQDGNLVTIETQKENDWLKGISRSSATPWIGANDLRREGDWRWVADDSEVKYKDWSPGMPDNAHDNEHCGLYYSNWKWNDGSCSSKTNFICEKEGCKNISNCITTVCTSLSDITCSECQKILFKLYNSNKECARTCSWEDRWCWPGNCGRDNYAMDCKCDSPSFSTVVDDNQARCQLAKVPEVLTCGMMVVDSNNDAIMSPIPQNKPTHCSYQEDFYGNLQVDRIVTNTTFELAVNVSHVPKPAYVTNHAFGITDVDISVVLKQISGDESIVKTTNLRNDPTSNDPKHLLSFNLAIDNRSPVHYLTNGERLCLRFIARGGGHLVSKNIITREESEIAFSKTRTSKDLCYHFDDVHPAHCLERNTCVTEPIYIDSRILTSRSFQVKVNGWEDPTPVPGNTEYASGIDTYLISMYEVKQAGHGQLEMGRVPIANVNVNHSIGIATIVIPFDLPNPSLYAVVLEVKDVANNVKQARRFVMFDNSSKVFARDNIPLYSTTATDSTDRKWQTNHGDLCYSWIGRYYNDKFNDLNLLQPIKPDYHGHISGIYEQNSGILPVSGTENIDGITNFYFSLANDTKIIFNNETVPNFTSQKICLSLPLCDGETYRFNVVAQDIMFHAYSEHIYTHIDSSEPEIFDIGLEKDDYQLLNVHNSSDLSKMVLKFNALDIHSGLHSVAWSLGTSFGGNDIGNGSLGIVRLTRNESCLEHSNCYCPSVGPCAYFNFTLMLNSLVHLNTHKGNHNRAYHFTISVANEARLSYVEHKEVLADDSPPAIGVVREGSLGGLDIDYTSKETVIAHWDGFIDHESGIRSYRVGLARWCLEEEAFRNNKTSGVLETTIIDTIEKSARLTLTEEGQYFVTVVAYNNAMEPSNPVCSDGVVLDRTPPVVVNVTIQSASVTEAMVCSDEKAWYVTKNLTRYVVRDDHCNKLCRNTSSNDFLLLLPVEASREPYQSSSCLISDSHVTIYLPIDLIHLQWNILELGSQIHDVYIGIGSTKESSASPDLIDYHKAPHTHRYKKRHVGLSDSDEIYIFLKITNSAALTTISTIGPVIVDETPPDCPSSLPVFIHNSSLYIYWNERAFADKEQKEPMTTFLYRVGRKGEYVSLFKPIGIPYTSTCVRGHTCLNISLSELQVYDVDLKFTFNIQLHVFNKAGYHCTVNTDTFHLPSQNPPGHGVVYDVTSDITSYFDRKQDIDVAILPDEFCITWEGFDHYGDIEFQLGLGKIPGSDDILPFHAVPNIEIYCENAKNLSLYRKNFVTVRAITSGGSVLAISDGFTIINSSDITDSVRVYDGHGCTRTSRAPMELKVGTTYIYIPSETTLHIGHTYTLASNVSLAIESDDVILTMQRTIDLVFYYQFIPLTVQPQFTIMSNTNHAFGLSVLNCVPDIDSQMGPNTVSLYWSIGMFGRYISYYEVELLSLSEGNGDPLILAYKKVSGNSDAYTFGDVNLVEGLYSFALRPCIEYTCLDRVKTDGFSITGKVYDGFSVSSSINRTARGCSDINLSLTELECPSGQSGDISGSVGLRWGLFRDKEFRTQITVWNVHTLKTKSTTVQISKCQKMPLYPHVDILTCVEVYCPVGSIGVICVPLAVTEDPNVFDKVRLYEVDSDAGDIRHNKDLFYATNIGDKMAWLHGAELDFTKDSVRPGGIILGMGDRPICWYLVRDSHNFCQPCEENPNCVASVVTLGGFSVFQGVNLEHEIMYFICAITKINEDAISSFQTCGNGFVIDVNPPSTGEVTIASEKGFLVEKASLIVHWTGFQDFHGYQTLGYPTSIARFTYSIGSNPHGQDVVAETDVGLYESVKIHNPSLHTGEVYYATVTAFDQVGHSTSAVSRGVMYDNTAPVTGAVQVGTYLKSTDIVAEEINVHLIGFHDNESGISKIRLGIGSTQHIPDVLNYQDYVGEFASLSNLTALHDGHHYYVIILVTNGAGLSSVAASDEFVVDRSAPTEGVVRDGRLSADVDFQANTTHSGCHWSGFSDPHSGIRYYSAGLGTVPLMDDVRPLSFTGTKTEVQWTFNFVPGSIYYCTVQACNGAGLCSSVSSNGFTTDNSPPLPGIVHVGLDGHHSRFWAHANSIQVQWFGFVDVESGIQNYEVCVRHTNNSECDILSFINVFLSNTMTHPVRLPRSVSLTVEVRAYNPLNMSTKSVSDSFIVDTTPPVLVTSPVLGVENRSSNVVTVQTDPSVIMLKWKFADEESPIVKQMISVRTHEDGHTPIKTIYLSGETAHTITLDPNNWMRSGDTYTAIVTACNEAGLCTSSKSNELLVDSTPPHLGGFKEPLHWHISSYSQETLSFVNLTLYGFKDIESGIKSYYVTVGDTYSGSEISDGVLTFLPSGSDGESEEIQLILTEHLQQGQHLILSFWAENNAGLLSNTGKVTVTAIVSSNMRTFGYLEILKHSCDAHYCNKECTCAVISQKCHEVDVDVDCKENNQTDDYDVKIDIQFDGQYNHQEFLATSACISANWIVTGIRGQDIKRMEWSMGQLGMPVGTGVFDPLLENQWHDVGKRTYVTHCLLRGNHLLHNTKYVVYVRAWTSTSDYTVFTSHPAHIDNTYPSVRKGKYITENQKRTCSHDVDFTTTLDTVTACWTGVFTDPQSGIRTHQVALGTIPGGDDVVPFKNVGINTSMSWDNLSLSPGTKYFVTVTCINNVGLLNTLVSDGFIVDNERPYAGIVYNTDRFNNAHVQKSRDIGVSFRGFHDRHSAIKSYSVAFDKSYANFTTENKSLVFQNIGLRNTFKFYNTSLVTGQWYRFAVKARDSAGFESEMVFSPPAMFDSTPPVHINISSISVMEEVTSLNGTLYWVKSLDGVKGPTVYKLHISSVNITSSNVFEVSFENEKQIHPVTIERDGICTAAISFISSPFYFGNRSLSVLARGIPLNTTLDFTLSISDDVTVTGQIDNVIEVQQVSPTELKINTHIMDAESGVRDIYVGAGSTKGGFQFHPLTRVSSSYNILLPVEASHGQTVYVTITAVNQAGCWSHFHSYPLLMDHTPPIISNAAVTTTYSAFGGETLTKVKVTWEVIDEESFNVYCSCKIGENRMKRTLYNDDGIKGVETPYILLDHGADIFARITCWNSANLQKFIMLGPKTVTLFAPEVTNARIAFETAWETYSGLPVMLSSSEVIFSWEIFDDTKGINGYSYRICQGTQHVTDWKNTELRNYASLDHALLLQDDIYTVEVKACDNGEMFCQAVNGSFLISGKSPTLTGLHPTVTRVDSGVLLTWDDVFNVQSELLPRYTVTAGTDVGYSDLLRLVKTTDRQVSFKDFNGSDVFVSITCSYVTGLFTTFRGKVATF